MTGLLAMGLGTPTGANSAPLAALTLQLDWLLTTQFAGLMVAEAQGLYGQQGVAVTLKPATAGLDLVGTVAQTPDMLGSVEQAVLLEAQADGVPVSAVATMFQASPLALMGPDSQSLATLQDLVGKRVGLHEDGLKALDLVLTNHGIDPHRVDRSLIPYTDKFEALTAGHFDAVQCYALDEPLDFAQHIGHAPALLKFCDVGFDAYAQVIFASDQLLAAQPAAVLAFLSATFDGWQRAMDDVAATAQLITTRYASSNVADLEYQQQTLQRLLPYVYAKGTQLGTISPQRWRQSARQLADCGLIEAVPTGGLWSQAWVS
ncbi:MAG: ABC transporter substrate-binding protein [Cyanobacteria bacterium P01_A01_bin.105]